MGGRPLALYESCNTELASGIFLANGLRMFAAKAEHGPAIDPHVLIARRKQRAAGL